MIGGEHLPVHILVPPANPRARWFQVWDVDGDAGTALVCTAARPPRPQLSVVRDNDVPAKAS